MQRFLATVVLTCLLVFDFSPALSFSAAFAQRRSNRTQKAPAASLASQRGADTITAAQLKDYLSFIASDVMEGRDTPSRGLDTTAHFLAMNVSRWGLKPVGDAGTYFQKIALTRDVIDKTETQVQLNNRTLVIGQDYIPVARAADINDASMVFAGNGWFLKSKNIDAYKGIDARGKVAIVFSPPDAFPRGITRTDLAGKRGEDWMDPAEYAQKQGAIAIVTVPDFQFLANWERNRNRMMDRGVTTIEKFQTSSGPTIPGIIASPQLTNVLFQGERQSATAIFESAYGGQALEPFELNPAKKLSIRIRKKSDIAATQNVVAVFEGSDPVLKNEYVAVGAHYDHVGVGIPVNGDEIYNGADDDASGTSALLAMAEALAKAGPRPKRSMLFIWHAGEEKGLWGSRYFTEFPTIPLENIITQINLDMIGRSKKEGDTSPKNNSLSGPNEIYVIGSKMMSTELGELTEVVNRQYLNLTYNFRYDNPNDPNRFFFRSDHYNYARKGIPIVFYFDGEHEDYHRPTDSPDKIDYQKMEKVTRTIYMTMWEIANRPARPRVDKPLPREFGGSG